MKFNSLTLLILLFAFVTLNAQSVSGKLTLNEKSETTLKLKTNSAVQLFKDFKTGKYQLQFSFDGEDLPTNVYNEKIVFFEFITTIKKDGELVKNVIRKQPIPYFPGDMGIPAEAFDFVGLLASNPIEDEDPSEQMIGTMPEGKYQIELAIKPIGLEGEIESLTINFILRKRPGRTKY
ncbi:MAG: hypothetical protein HRU50_08135 [Winogradskyella sp.]|uniref:hypothetical protein n=1 Tax=Winogradskyella sp. TaxID=1883156 RepID=UPI0025FA906C|nr:hypothetical protein [Winogradskyella sp.]NRB59885.1 hypothetical protein [Winogradskyella sp.]